MNREDRKKLLIAQGAVYRTEILLARQSTEDKLRPDSLVRSVLQQAALAAIALIRNRGAASLPGVNLQTLLPIVMGGISALSRRKGLLKTLLRSAAVASAAAGIVAIVSKKKKKKQTDQDTPAAEQA